MSTTLNNGRIMPLIGFGTYTLKHHECRDAVLAALQAGYKFIDTAAVYRNEDQVASAIEQAIERKYISSREELFITTKLNPKDQKTADHVVRALKASLQQLKTTYVDLYLIHWPATSGIRCGDVENIGMRNDCWRAMAALQKEGLCRSIGVSNFLVRHLAALPPPVPQVNQIELHALCRQQDVVTYCEQHRIHVQAYSPFASSDSRLVENKAILQLAAECSTPLLRLTPGNLLLLELLTRNFSVLPRSTNPKHIQENLLCLKLLEEGNDGENKGNNVNTRLVKSKIKELVKELYDSTCGATDFHACWFSAEIP